MGRQIMENAPKKSQVFQTVQYQFAAHLRDPDTNPPPAGVEERRVAVYRNLIYKNIEGFISGGFPVLRSVMTDAEWHKMVRDFIARHTSHSPYFLKISEEFLKYLQNERGMQAADPPFILELAHYEWVELALDVSPEQFPAHTPLCDDLLNNIALVSPLAWCLSYQYPVHRIGPGFQPQEPGEQPTFLIVYRTRHDTIEFMESNAITVRLLNILEGNRFTGRDALLLLAGEMQHPNPESLLKYGAELLHKLLNCDVIYTI